MMLPRKAENDMPRYIDADSIVHKLRSVATDEKQDGLIKVLLLIAIEEIEKEPTADVVPRSEVFEEVDKFRTNIMNKFIYLCRGNDYNKLTLLKIGDVVDEMYDVQIAELKKKYTEGEE
jgi:hypothetical protein